MTRMPSPRPDVTENRDVFPAGERSSRQRSEIFAYLRSTESHPSAEDVLAAVRRKIPKVGLATVYRNLDALVQSGAVSRTTHRNTSRYDIRTDPHHHFCCDSCGSITNIDARSEEVEIIRKIARRSRVRVTSVSLELKGLCRNCR